MFRLWSNNPKELFEYPDYTFYDHFGCFLPSYLPRAFIYDYLTGRAKASNIRQFIRFNTVVRHVDFDNTKNEFNVEIEDFNTGSIESLNFDRVILAAGHHHTPNMLKIDGVDQFPGRVLHSHEFRGADEFVGLNLLIIGSSFSAADIAIQCYKFGARSVIISSRRGLVGFKWPDDIKETPLLVRMENRTAHFQDGSTVDNIDAIIFCTGYRHSYPFMAKKFRLHCGITEFVPSNLYKSIFWIDQPNLAYLGTPRQIYSLPLFELQAALVRDVFLGHNKLPDKNQWEVDVNKWQMREKAIAPADYFAMVDLQTDYLHDLLGLLRTYDGNQSLSEVNFDKANQVTKKFLESMSTDIQHYRDISYESLVDTKNKKVVQVCKPWIENKDDSMENLLNDYRKEL
jgi:trimethylamine monooxygenase